MIRTFIRRRKNVGWNELVQVNTETGAVKQYAVDKEIGFPFSETYTTVSEMGWNTVDDLVKHMLEASEEIDSNRQKAEEIAGLLNLAKYRAEHNKHMCLILEDGTKKNDIVDRLLAYGLTVNESLRIIDYYVNLGVMAHKVVVGYTNGDRVTTEIAGSVDDVCRYYKVVNTFNIGIANDNLQKVTRMEFIY